MLVALLTTLLAACGSGGNQTGDPVTTQPGMKPTITIDEANQRSQQYLDQAANDLFPAPITRTPSPLEERGSCTDPDDNGPTNRLKASREYKLDGVSAADFPRYFDSLRTWWKGHGYVLGSDKGNASGHLLNGESADGFIMALQSNDVGGLYLSVASPCVWPNGTPEPQG
jgi:hypothetical protein